MTAKSQDSVIVESTRYDLCGVHGEGLFEPRYYDIETEPPTRACSRGYACGYAIREKQLFLTELEIWSDPSLWNHYRRRIAEIFGASVALAGDHPLIDVRQLTFPVPFTGGLYLGRGFMEETHTHIGTHPAHTYREVIELTFESGNLLASANRSFEMAEVRLRQSFGEEHRRRQLARWIDDSFWTTS